jgi:hypothetical protein
MKTRTWTGFVVSIVRFTRKVVALMAIALGTTTIAVATPQSYDYRGTPLLVGGVSEEERDAMRAEAAHYNVWLVFAERDTGNYLADVKVRVIDGNNNAVVDVVADGPWLLAQLPPGQYKVRTSDGQEQAITAGAGTHPMTILRLARQP